MLFEHKFCVEGLVKVSRPQIGEVKARAWSHSQQNHRKVNLKQKACCYMAPAKTIYKRGQFQSDFITAAD